MVRMVLPDVQSEKRDMSHAEAVMIAQAGVEVIHPILAS
jgi:hypothetical protein